MREEVGEAGRPCHGVLLPSGGVEPDAVLTGNIAFDIECHRSFVSFQFIV